MIGACVRSSAARAAAKLVQVGLTAALDQRAAATMRQDITQLMVYRRPSLEHRRVMCTMARDAPRT